MSTAGAARETPQAQPAPATEADGPPSSVPPRSERLGWEVLLVLGISLGASGVYAVVDLINRLTVPVALNQQVSQLNPTIVTDNRHWLDFIYQVLSIGSGLVPPLLALFLLARNPGGPGFSIGFDRLRLPRETLQGLGFAALIGIPGLGLVYVAHRAGFNTQIAASGLPDIWYRIPVLVASALQNATSEEVIVMGYLLTRLNQLGWSRSRSIGAAAVLRGSYHLYQGFGGFAGNAVMGLIFGWWFTRTRRVLPLLIAHFVIDTISFVGYIYLHNRFTWI